MSDKKDTQNEKIDEIDKEQFSDTESDLSEEEISEEVDEVALLKEQVASLEDKYLREHAEFENIKKRMEREKAQAIAYAHEQFARDLLSVIDSLDSAASLDEQEVTEESYKKLKEGIDLTLNQFAKAFQKHGVELVGMDSGFDPDFHQAVMHVDSQEHNSGDVVQVLQKGYKIKDRVLRPAMVSVCK